MNKISFTSKLTTALALSFGALSFSPRPATPEPPSPEPAKVKPVNEASKDEKEFQTAVNKAIDRGVEWLKSKQNKDGAWLRTPEGPVTGNYIGHQALAILTLAKCGMTERDPEMARALRALDKLFVVQAGPKLETAKSYDMAFTILAYQALYDREDSSRAKPEIVKRIKQIVKWFEDKQEKNIWRYPSADHSEDLSVTQYVLLALEMASRFGVKAQPEIYTKALEGLLRLQEKTGPEVTLYIATPEWKPGSTDGLYGTKVKSRGFHYASVDQGYARGSMTAGGLSSLAIVKSQLIQLKALTPEKERIIDTAMFSAWAWLSKNFSLDKNASSGNEIDTLYKLCSFYATDRALTIVGIQNRNEHDWHREMATRLISDQTQDGSWLGSWTGPEQTGERLDTCFALLTLKHATTPPVVSVKPPVTTPAK